MGAAGGPERLPWLFTATFLTMLAAVPAFGWLVARVPRRTLLPLVYAFFIGCILGLFALLRSPVRWAPAVFFVWLSVFNLFVVSVFWSFMADLWREAQARRLFGLIAAGGSAGALAGPALTAALAPRVGPVNLLPAAAALLSGALLCILVLRRRPPAPDPTGRAADERAPVGGGALAGIVHLARSPYLGGIAAFVVLATALGTLLYVQQVQIIRTAFPDPARRTAVFALMDISVNALTIGAQALATGRLVQRFGLPPVLASLPALSLGGLVALAASPTAAVLVPLQVLWRATQYGIAGPAREMLFTVVSREDKYKTKNVIDTVVYRGGDALSAWLFAALAAAGLGWSGLAVAAMPLAAAWVAVALYLGRRQTLRRRRLEAEVAHGPGGR
jgi:AAA family ATP:ADP antiporter